ncbi:hypothetical protein pipiens_003963 [Culex pipiens pipiens]|uniref:Uncharacterized protein n=1 Tax=Culex pipiens pipiens TaxID=38569 RepID=A0ABD1CRZ6_CULPP
MVPNGANISDHPFRKTVLKWKIRSVAAVLLLLAFAEHLLSVANNVSNLRREVDYCNWTIRDPVKFFCVRTFSTAFHTVAYSLPVAAYNELTGTIITYELVMLSYRKDSSEQHSNNPSCDPCNDLGEDALLPAVFVVISTESQHCF